MLGGLVQDLRFGLRTLRNSPGFTTIALLTLAVGIGANTAIFSFADALLLKPLPYAEPDRILRVLEKMPGGGTCPISSLNYLDWARENTVFEAMAAAAGAEFTLTGGAEPVRLRGGVVGVHYFDIFGRQPTIGRTFAADEDREGKGRVAILSHRLWQTQFGGDPKIVGRKIVLDQAPYTVIGVLPAGSAFDRGDKEIWCPLVFEPANMTRNYHWLWGYARLKRGISLEHARAEMNTIGARIARQYPDSNKGWGVNVERIENRLVRPQLRQSALVLMAAVVLILLIACANLANLTLARTTGREREGAVRAALGAGRGRLVSQFLTESLLLAAGGGALGIGLGYAAMRALRAAIPPFSVPREIDVAMDGRVMLFALALSFFTGVLFGLAPAWQASRPDLAGAMKEGGHGTPGGRRRGLRNLLAVMEVALAFMLLAGAGLLLRSFYALSQVDPGVDLSNVLTMQLPVDEKQYPDPARLNEYLREILVRIGGIPGVREAALTDALPLEGWPYGMHYLIDGRPYVDPAHRSNCFFKTVSPSYFHTLGIKLRRGRELSDRDTTGAPPVLMINETFARKEFPNQDPIGKVIRTEQMVPGKTQLGPEIPWRIVGVIADEKIDGLDDRTSAGVYASMEQSPQYNMWLGARTALAPLAFDRAIRDAVHQFNPEQPVSKLRTLEQIKGESVAGDRLQTILLGSFGAVGLLLSAMGIYGIMSYTVGQRRHEIGIRTALGASAGSVVGMVLRDGMRLAAIGLVIGTAGALVLGRLLGKLLFGVPSHDPLTLAAAAGILGGVALLACYIPARRAAHVDAMAALRYE